jgi:ABC-2 type transport system ATP-binding protein
MWPRSPVGGPSVTALDRRPPSDDARLPAPDTGAVALTATAPPASRLAVRTTGLTKRYGTRAVVDAIDLELPRGVISGFVGPNGAGKTTTLRMLLGLIRPSAGTGEVLGHPITDPASYLQQVGALIEAPAFYPTISGRRNLEILATLGRHGRPTVDSLLDQVGLGDRGGDAFKTYSLGMKQRLGIAAALLPDPELLVLDEPTNGLDPAGIREVRALLRELADNGLTVVVSSHLLGEIQTICDHLVVIDAGRLRYQGAIDGLISAQTAEVIAMPEHAADLQRLAALCTEAGHAARVVDGEVHAAAPAGWAPELNRLAMGRDITLAGLSINRGTLEDAFFAITDSDAHQILAHAPEAEVQA